MEKVSKDVAEKELERWFEFKKIGERKKEAYKENSEIIIDAICEGYLVLNENHEWEQTLKFPFNDEMPLEKLIYKPRLNMKGVQSYLEKVKATDGDGRLAAYISALTKKPSNIVKFLDSEDLTIGQSIAIFFL